MGLFRILSPYINYLKNCDQKCPIQTGYRDLVKNRICLNQAPIIISGHFGDLCKAPSGYCHLISGTLIPSQNQRKSGVHFTPNPGTMQSPILGIAQSGPRSGTDNPLFDRKLLEYLHEQGVREKRLTKPDPGIIRADPGIPVFVVISRGNLSGSVSVPGIPRTARSQCRGG
jgi:hypothetical protein